MVVAWYEETEKNVTGAILILYYLQSGAYGCLLEYPVVAADSQCLTVGVVCGEVWWRAEGSAFA